MKMYQVYECKDVEDAVQKLGDEISAIVDKMAPVRTIRYVRSMHPGY